MRNQGARNAYHRLLGGSFSLRGAGRLLLPSQPSGRYRDSSALKVKERGRRRLLQMLDALRSHGVEVLDDGGGRRGGELKVGKNKR